MKRILLAILFCVVMLSASAVIHSIGELQVPFSDFTFSVQDTIAYFVADGALHIYSISNPDRPRYLSTYSALGQISHVQVSGNRAYLTGYYMGLTVVDVSNPALPVGLGRHHNIYVYGHITVVNNLVFVCNNGGSVSIFNVSNPIRPILLSTTNMGSEVSQISVSGNRLFAVETYNLRIYDISNPTTPLLLSISESKYYLKSIDVNGNHAYVLSYEGGLIVYDVSNPSNPFVASHLDIGSTMYVVRIKADRAYLLGYSVLVVDISNPINPMLLGTYDNSYHSDSMNYNIVDCERFCVGSNNILYVYDQTYSVVMIDASDPYNEMLENIIPFICNGAQVSRDNDLLLVASLGGNLLILDVADPTEPEELYWMNMIQSDIWDAGGFIKGGYIYTVSPQEGLKVYDATDPSEPVIVSTMDYPLRSRIEIVGNVAYSLEWGNFVTLDLRYPRRPALLGSLSVNGTTPRSFALHNDMAYVITQNRYLNVIDVSNPATPVLIGSCVTPLESPYYLASVIVSSDHAYILGTRGVNVVDVSNPQNPVCLESIMPYPGCNLRSMYIHDNMLYISDVMRNTIFSYDVSVPNTPQLVKTFLGDMDVYKMLVVDGYLYCFGSSRLGILNLNAVGNDDLVLTAQSKIQLYCYPNPFSAKTTLSLDLPTVENVKLRVYNMKGQLVRDLCNETKSQGKHIIDWDGLDSWGKRVPTGIYIAKFGTGKNSISKKITRF